MSQRAIEVHNGYVVIDAPIAGLDINGNVDILTKTGQVLNVEKEGGVNEDYWNKFKVTSTDDLALVDKIMAGVVAQCCMAEGEVSGGLSRLSALHGYLEVFNAGIGGGARSAYVTLQTLGAAGQTVDAGIDFLGGAHTITDLIRLTSGTIVNVLQSIAVAGVVDSATGGETATKAGYLKIDIAGTTRYVRLYEGTG